MSFVFRILVLFSLIAVNSGTSINLIDYHSNFAYAGEDDPLLMTDLILDGVVFHPDIQERSATIRSKSEKSGKIYRVGDVLMGFKLLRIEESSVTLYDGKKLLKLRLDPLVLDISDK